MGMWMWFNLDAHSFLCNGEHNMIKVQPAKANISQWVYKINI